MLISLLVNDRQILRTLINKIEVEGLIDKNRSFLIDKFASELTSKKVLQFSFYQDIVLINLLVSDRQKVADVNRQIDRQTDTPIL